jgi:hypothetical protein
MAQDMGEFPQLEGALYQKLLPSGMMLAVYAMLFNDRLCVGYPHDTFGYERGWCVPKGMGVEIAKDWDGESDPPHWIKEVGTERRPT